MIQPTSLTAPAVVAHSSWRFLLREVARAHPALVQGTTAHNLQYVLKPLASVAWWIHTYRPELLEKASLQLLLAGCGIQEAVDGGRWWGLLPWFLGRPSMHVDVTLVGDQMTGLDEQAGAFRSSQGLSQARLEQLTVSPLGHLVKKYAPARLIGGRLQDWRAQAKPQIAPVLPVSAPGPAPAYEAPDLLVLFSPGFESHYDSWLTWDDLLPFLLAGTPTACFAYSALDQASDAFALGACGLKAQPSLVRDNPWADAASNARQGVGCFAAKAWALQLRESSQEVLRMPQVQALKTLPFVDERMQAWHMVQRCMEHEFRMEGDICIERLGTFVNVKGRPVTPAEASTEEASFCRLPDGWAVHQGTRQVFRWDNLTRSFVPHEPGAEVPQAFFEGQPRDPHAMVERAIWAVAMHMAHVTPQTMAPFYDAWNARPAQEQPTAGAGTPEGAPVSATPA